MTDSKGLSYKDSGVDIDLSDAAKEEMAKSIGGPKDIILNSPGAFATLISGRFEGYEDPVLVLKTEEPGSKQKLAFQHNRVRSVCFDMINHLINDVLAMGATPMAVQDAIFCGTLDKDLAATVVQGISDACAEQGCHLTGGETSIQPGVVPDGTYILCSFLLGVVERSKIIDGSKISDGDVVVALASNGPHTNGYTLIRKLIDTRPEVLEKDCGGTNFLDAILVPHKCYLSLVSEALLRFDIRGLAHITGGGISDNLKRILPTGLDAEVDLGAVRVPEVFRVIQELGGVPEVDMLRTFNNGVGFVVVLPESELDTFLEFCDRHDQEAFRIGKIGVAQGDTPSVRLNGALFS